MGGGCLDRGPATNEEEMPQLTDYDSWLASAPRRHDAIRRPANKRERMEVVCSSAWGNE